MSKVKMYIYGGYYRGINVDNVANSPVIPFDGDWEAFEKEMGPEGWNIDVGI